MTINRHASSYLNGAYLRMVEAITAAEVPAFSIFPTSDEFENAEAFLKTIAQAVDEIVHAVASEADDNAPNPITHRDRIAVISDALHDSSLLDDLREAAERLREDEREIA